MHIVNSQLFFFWENKIKQSFAITWQTNQHKNTLRYGTYQPYHIYFFLNTSPSLWGKITFIHNQFLAFSYSFTTHVCIPEQDNLVLSIFEIDHPNEIILSIYSHDLFHSFNTHYSLYLAVVYSFLVLYSILFYAVLYFLTLLFMDIWIVSSVKLNKECSSEYFSMSSGAQVHEFLCDCTYRENCRILGYAHFQLSWVISNDFPKGFFQMTLIRTAHKSWNR